MVRVLYSDVTARTARATIPTWPRRMPANDSFVRSGAHGGPQWAYFCDPATAKARPTVLAIVSSISNPVLGRVLSFVHSARSARAERGAVMRLAGAVAAR